MGNSRSKRFSTDNPLFYTGKHFPVDDSDATQELLLLTWRMASCKPERPFPLPPRTHAQANLHPSHHHPAVSTPTASTSTNPASTAAAPAGTAAAMPASAITLLPVPFPEYSRSSRQQLQTPSSQSETVSSSSRPAGLKLGSGLQGLGLANTCSTTSRSGEVSTNSPATQDHQARNDRNSSDYFEAKKSLPRVNSFSRDNRYRSFVSSQTEKSDLRRFHEEFTQQFLIYCPDLQHAYPVGYLIIAKMIISFITCLIWKKKMDPIILRFAKSHAKLELSRHHFYGFGHAMVETVSKRLGSYATIHIVSIWEIAMAKLVGKMYSAYTKQRAKHLKIKQKKTNLSRRNKSLVIFRRTRTMDNKQRRSRPSDDLKISRSHTVSI
mmetsp:Transcript_6075/g.11185  ORF Transcript_6075/g.11185 Transcript_6075/m.11185 type:complete len:380 (+) Transcript_6075:288-1427(+)